MIGSGWLRCGAEANMLARSCKASFTIRYWSISSFIMAFWRYLTPPWINFVLRLLVPDAKSSISTKAVFKPLVTASSAQPDPDAPPPIIRTSKLSVWRDLICSSLVGSCLLARLSFGAAAACTCCTFKFPSLVKSHVVIHAPAPNATVPTASLLRRDAICSFSLSVNTQFTAWFSPNRPEQCDFDTRVLEQGDVEKYKNQLRYFYTSYFYAP